MTIMIIFLSVFWILIALTDTACIFPADIRGIWYSSRHGELRFNDRQITGAISAAASSPQIYECVFTGSENRYISRATVNFFSTVTGFIYLCMNFDYKSSGIYSFTYDTDFSATTNERVTAFVDGSGVNVTESNTCTIDKDQYPAGGQEFIVKKDSIHSVACPTVLQKTFMVFVTSGSCSGSSLDGKSNTSRLSYTYSSCASSLIFSSDGLYDCVYSFRSGRYIILTVLNKDNNTDESSTYRFSCYVLETRFQTVYASEHPQVCHSGQTPLTVASTGRLLVLEDLDPEFKARSLVAVSVIVGFINLTVWTFFSVSFQLWFMTGKYNKRKPRIRKKEEEEFDFDDFDLEQPRNLTPIEELQETDTDDGEVSRNKSTMSGNMSKDTSVSVDEEREEVDGATKSLEYENCGEENKAYLQPDGSVTSQLEENTDTVTPIRPTNSAICRAEDAHAVGEHGSKMSLRRTASSVSRRNDSSQNKENRGSARDSRRPKPLVVPCMYIDNRKSRLNISQEREHSFGLDHGNDIDNTLDENFESKPEKTLTKSLSMKSDEQKKNVQFDDDQNFSIEVYYKIPEWQRQWENFQDPFSYTSSVNDGARSMRSVSTLLSIPHFAWTDPDLEEHRSLGNMWQKVDRLFPGISKKHFREAYYEDGLLNVRRSFDERHQSESEIKTLPIINNRRRPSRMHIPKSSN